MKSYFAFISYKRGCRDEHIANWVHSKLEKYPYPQELVNNDNRPNHTKFIRNIFIDTKDLHVSENEFSSEIKHALENSKYLIVICSNNSVKSKYVEREILYFLQTHKNDFTKILPVVIDNIENSMPAILSQNNILSRNIPIYNTFLDQKNEINQYCFYHIVSFLLKVDFNIIYDRYKNYAAKKNRNRKFLKLGINSLILISLIFMSISFVANNRLIQKQKDIVTLEKQIFPYSVMTGYMNNFLLPVVEYFKVNEPEAHIFIHMPTDVEDLNDNHRYRFDYFTTFISKRLGLDSISQTHLETSMPRGSIVHKMYSTNNPNLNHNYIDFASTTSTFLEIAKLKKTYQPYSEMELDDMIEEYTDIFINQAKETLKNDTTHVSFVKSLQDVENYIK